MPKLDANQLPDLRARIGALPSRSTLSTFEAIVALRECIEAALARGQTLAAIASLLERDGIRIQPSTLRWHLWRVRKLGAVPANKPLVRPREPAAMSAAQQDLDAPPAPAPAPTGPEKPEPSARPGQFVLTPDLERL